MTTLLYGLVLSRNSHLVPSHITGVGGGMLRVLDGDSLGGLVSTVQAATRRPTLEHVRAYDHALQSVVHHGATTLAVRYGQTFTNDDECRRHVAEHRDRYSRLLDVNDGCVEMRILLASSEVARPAASAAAGPGRAYLESIKRAGRVEGVSLRDAIGPIVRAEHVEATSGGAVTVFSHLIARSDEQEYRGAAAAVPALGAAAIVGPLALYSFAEPVA